MYPILSVPVPSTCLRRVKVLYETWNGEERVVFVRIPVSHLDTEAVMLSKACEKFREHHGFEDRLISVNLFPNFSDCA